MSDKIFEVSFCTLAAAVIIWIAAGIALTAVGLPWANVQTPLLIFLTILIGLIVLMVGGGVLLYLWGRNYMARG